MITETVGPFRIGVLVENKRVQHVYEASWEIMVEDKPTLVSQLFSGKDFQAAFFKARKWAQGNAYGELVTMIRRQDVVI